MADTSYNSTTPYYYDSYGYSDTDATDSPYIIISLAEIEKEWKEEKRLQKLAKRRAKPKRNQSYKPIRTYCKKPGIRKTAKFKILGARCNA